MYTWMFRLPPAKICGITKRGLRKQDRTIREAWTGDYLHKLLHHSISWSNLIKWASCESISLSRQQVIADKLEKFFCRSIRDIITFLQLFQIYWWGEVAHGWVAFIDATENFDQPNYNPDKYVKIIAVEIIYVSSSDVFRTLFLLHRPKLVINHGTDKLYGRRISIWNVRTICSFLTTAL